MSVKFLLSLYGLYALPVAVHELLHCIVALCFRVKVERFCLGNWLHLKCGRLWLSPFLLSGYVDVDAAQLLRKSRSVIFLFYLGGAAGNLFLMGLGSLLLHNKLLKIWFLIVNSAALLLSLLPVVEDNDFWMLRYAIRERNSSDIRSG